MADHPYRSLPDHCFWKRSIADVAESGVDPVVAAKFTISRQHRVATAGSCFAQHIARHLAASGFNYFVTETAHPLLPTNVQDAFNYGVFTARYGNLYSSRQLIQLLQRAYGQFTPADDIWRRPDGRFIDPYRPQIQPDGFATEAEFHADRRQHLAAIRRAVEELDVFVFTFGLTETWVNRQDGAAYPLCPGVAGGTYDDGLHAFVNLGVAEVVADMQAAIALIHARNAQARFILTVSPVPLVATVENRSVLVSTTYSKSVLRIAAEQLAAAYDYVAYFPSYEVITGNFNRGKYFADDLRSVTEAGVAHVMRLFMHHYAEDAGTAATAAEETVPISEDVQSGPKQAASRIAAAVRVVCEEEALDRIDLEAAALIAEARRASDEKRWDDAAEQWAAICARFPQESDALLYGSLALRQLGRAEQANALIELATRRFPGLSRIAIIHARQAFTAGDLAEAARRAIDLRIRFPGRADGYALGARAARLAGRFEEAEAITSAAMGQFPESAALAMEYAKAAAGRRDWDEAERRCMALRGSFPDPELYRIAIRALLKAGRSAEAEAWEGEFAQRFPNLREQPAPTLTAAVS